MPDLSPPTQTEGEQKAMLRATAKHPRDHLIFSLALGTGLRLSELVGLNAGDVLAPDRKAKCSAHEGRDHEPAVLMGLLE